MSPVSAVLGTRRRGVSLHIQKTQIVVTSAIPRRVYTRTQKARFLCCQFRRRHCIMC